MKEYTIKEISEMFRLPPSTLRYYEEMGLLTNIPRSASGQRIYLTMHVNRLKTICCFKNAGMSIPQLKEFFSYEASEEEHIDEILLLLTEHKEATERKLKQLQSTYIHILRKLNYYGDIKKCIEADAPIPDWQDYNQGGD